MTDQDNLSAPSSSSPQASWTRLASTWRSSSARIQRVQTVYGLAFAYMEMGDIEQAQKHFQTVLEMSAPEELRALVRNGLWESTMETTILILAHHLPH